MDQQAAFLSETPGGIVIERFPFRFQPHHKPWLLQYLFNLTISMMLAAPLMILTLFVASRLLGDAHSSIPPLIALIEWLAMVASLWTYRIHQAFDVKRGLFSEFQEMWGRRFFAREWPVSLFDSISHGLSRSAVDGRSPVVRLHAKAEGFIVDDMFSTRSLEEAQHLAEHLGVLTGLKVFGQYNTGPQHKMNDLRRNAWMAERIARR